jgi:hypothetical protein
MGETLTDEWYARISSDDSMPDLYIGRLPAQSAADASEMVAKILTYENTPNSRTWEKNVLLIADDQTEAYEAIFETMNENAAALLPSKMLPFKGYLADYLLPADLTADIKTRIDAGALIFNYSGHGSLQRWAGESIFENSDVTTLTNNSMYPFFINMSCLTGYFGYLSQTKGPEPSLAEMLLTADSKGAVAALMPTAMTTTVGQHILNTALFDAFFTEDIRELGPAIVQAKQILLANGGTVFEEISETFLLFGDPALKLKIPLPRMPTGVVARFEAEGVRIQWQSALDCNGNAVAGYHVYRASSPAGHYSKINTELIADTGFMDTSVEVGVDAGSGDSIYYAVSSEDAEGDESAQSFGFSPALIVSSADGGGGGCFIGSAAKYYSWNELFSGLMKNIAFISHQIGAAINNIVYNWHNGSGFHTFNRLRIHGSFSLNGNQDALFSGCFAAFVPHSKAVSGFTTDEFFIHLNHSAQRWQCRSPILHHHPNRMANFPCRALFNTDQTAQKNRGDAFTGVDHIIIQG